MFTRQKSDFDAYSKIRNHSTFMVRKARLLFEAKLATNVKDNPKKFWSYVNQTIKVKPGVSTLEQEDGTVIEKDADIAEALNDYFCSVFTRENLDSSYTLLTTQNFWYLPYRHTNNIPRSLTTVIKIKTTQISWSRSMSSMCVIQYPGKFSSPPDTYL